MAAPCGLPQFLSYPLGEKSLLKMSGVLLVIMSPIPGRYFSNYIDFKRSRSPTSIDFINGLHTEYESKAVHLFGPSSIYKFAQLHLLGGVQLSTNHLRVYSQLALKRTTQEW